MIYKCHDTWSLTIGRSNDMHNNNNMHLIDPFAWYAFVGYVLDHQDSLCIDVFDHQDSLSITRQSQALWNQSHSLAATSSSNTRPFAGQVAASRKHCFTILATAPCI